MGDFEQMVVIERVAEVVDVAIVGNARHLLIATSRGVNEDSVDLEFALFRLNPLGLLLAVFRRRGSSFVVEVQGFAGNR